MPLAVTLLGLLLSLRISARCAAMDATITPGQALSGNDKLVSSNGKFALGFFLQTGSSKSSSHDTSTSWYLGIWYNRIPKLTPVWVANGDSPVRDPSNSELAISGDGGLVVVDRSNGSIVVWSAQTRTTMNDTVAVLRNSGNLVLRSSSDPSDVLWQSFDHPTDTFLPGAKLGWNKISGLNTHLVSRKNSADLAPGRYRVELDPSGANQYIFTASSSSTPYWSSGVWNGQYFPSIPEMAGPFVVNFTFVDNDQERYFTYNLLDETVVFHHFLDVSGRTKTFVWLEGSQDWVMTFAQPKVQCDVSAVCGPFTICDDNELRFCKCMEGFSVKSPQDWELDDRTDGCVRDTPLDCASSRSTSGLTDKFRSIACVRLPQNGYSIEAATSVDRCALTCSSNCSCTAYSYGNGGCSVWYDELLNVKQQQCDGMADSNGRNLYIRFAAREEQSRKKNTRGSLCFVALFMLATALVIWWNKRKRYSCTSNNVEGESGIVAFRFIDLHHATKNFSEKLGEGGFGSVFKGFLHGSRIIAVKRLAGAHQGEKQFRAEVSSIGLIQHINLVKLIGFCCDNDSKLLVYEHMPNRSLDLHLFSTDKILNWDTRYQIALGVARGLSYLHESCRDCIIHCDVKPQNILLTESFAPKIADFGMAKFLGRDFSRVLTTMRGTVGYLAPEWISGVPVTPKVDVYSYGMVLLEIVSGRRNSSGGYSTSSDEDVYFPVEVTHKLLDGGVESLVDLNLHGNANLKEVERVCKVACWCIQDNESDRPSMGEVVQILEGLFEPDTPPMPRLLQAIAGSSCSTSR
uniref:Receptor-like serine/threonine-protein kinase n=1 Tax=Oryza brachyantha TaxID=4533 RepID=J3LXT4_ORYBR